MLSQEDLADGICAVPTLSRIENGNQLPTKNHLEALLERLGYSTIMVESYADGKTLRIHELQYNTQQNYIYKNLDKARACLQQLEPLIIDHKSLDWQFVLLYRILLNENSLTPEEQLIRLEEALLLSCPRYKTKGLPKLLSFREITIFNNIAWALGKLGQLDEAITILEHIMAYYDRNVIIPEEALRTQPMILYNLSKLLGLAERYNECIEVCERGIQIARQTGRCQNLPATLYNRAWALLRRRWPTDFEQAEKSLRQACYMAYSMEKENAYLHFAKYYEEVFGQLDL